MTQHSGSEMGTEADSAWPRCIVSRDFYSDKACPEDACLESTSGGGLRWRSWQCIEDSMSCSGTTSCQAALPMCRRSSQENDKRRGEGPHGKLRKVVQETSTWDRRPRVPAYPYHARRSPSLALARLGFSACLSADVERQTVPRPQHASVVGKQY